MNCTVEHLPGETPQAPALAADRRAAASTGDSRFELKYLVPDHCAGQLRSDLLSYLVHDRHVASNGTTHSTVRSLYFDTPNIRAYYEKLHGDACRAKVRIRRYETGDTPPSDWFFEIKSKYHNACFKPRRLPFPDLWLREHLLAHGTIRLNALLDRLSPDELVSQQALLWALPVEPKLLVLYEREALVDPHRSRFRVTLDSGVRAVFTANPYASPGPRDRIGLPVLMEVKFTRSIPAWLEALIRKYHLQKESISKYGQGMEASVPLFGLPRPRGFSDEGVAPAVVRLVKNILDSWSAPVWAGVPAASPSVQSRA